MLQINLARVFKIGGFKFLIFSRILSRYYGITLIMLYK
jgi:hypothetical protein